MTADVISMKHELTKEKQALRARMTAFGLTFPSVRYASGVEPWNAVELES